MILSHSSSKLLSFPFCPNIMWTVKNGKYIVPKLDGNILARILNGKNINVICYGDLIESYFSLSFLEAFIKNNLGISYQWIGNEKFKDLIQIQGIAKYNNSLKEKDINKFPLPFFSDLEGNIYFNSLLNYRVCKTYYGFYGYHNQKSFARQIFANSLLQWNKSFVPKLRNFSNDNKYKNLVLIFPDQTEFSSKKIDCLNLSISQLKSLQSLLTMKGYHLLLITNNHSRYYEFDTLPITLKNIFTYIEQAKYILSNQIDFLLLALYISKAKIIYSYPIQKRSIREFILDDNFNFLNGRYATKKEIVWLQALTVMDTYNNIIND